MSTEPLEAAVASTRDVLATVRPDQLGQSTPCARWAVADVVNHLVNGHHFFASAVAGAPPPGDERDAAAGDFLAAYDEATSASIAAFGAEGAMDRLLHLPFGDLPGSVFIGIAATDTLAHGWDLAKATGQPTDLAPDLAAALLARVQPLLADSLRGTDDEGRAFGPEQPAPDGATSADRLAAFLGRSV
jgi:uncharacterized protein (TIGR03086 family)